MMNSVTYESIEISFQALQFVLFVVYSRYLSNIKKNNFKRKLIMQTFEQKISRYDLIPLQTKFKHRCIII